MRSVWLRRSSMPPPSVFPVAESSDLKRLIRCDGDPRSSRDTDPDRHIEGRATSLGHEAVDLPRDAQHDDPRALGADGLEQRLDMAQGLRIVAVAGPHDAAHALHPRLFDRRRSGQHGFGVHFAGLRAGAQPGPARTADRYTSDPVRGPRRAAWLRPSPPWTCTSAP